VKLIISTLFIIYLKAKTHIKHFFLYSYINSGVKGLNWNLYMCNGYLWIAHSNNTVIHNSSVYLQPWGPKHFKQTETCPCSPKLILHNIPFRLSFHYNQNLIWLFFFPSSLSYLLVYLFKCTFTCTHCKAHWELYVRQMHYYFAVSNYKRRQLHHVWDRWRHHGSAHKGATRSV